MKPAVALAFALVLLLCAHAQDTPESSPFFSNQAVYVYLGKKATSPDGKKVVSVRLLDNDAGDFPTLVTVKMGRGELHSKIRFGLNAEVLWSEDSKAFAVTGSSDGANGQYHTSAFLLLDGKLVQVPLTPLIERAFGHPVKCGWPESPNVSAIKWLGHTRELLVAAEIIHHSNCDSFGTFKGFVVDVVNRTVLKAYDQLEMKRRFGPQLGPELLQARDECVRNPKSCYVESNHPELHKR